MTNLKVTHAHPSDILQGDIVEKIRSEAAGAESSRSLTAAQINVILQQQWFNIYIPKSYGGLELSLPEILSLEEAIAWADGSTGWVVTLCSGAAWFVGFLSPSIIEEIFTDERVCFAGSGAVTGIAAKLQDGYLINGNWKYATGSALATVFTMNCRVMENGLQLYHADGTPVVKSILLKRSEVKIYNTWNAMGMIATGSNAFEAKDVFVPLNRAFVIQPDQASLNNIIFQFPFLQLAETTLAVNISGMACRFIELCEAILLEKSSDRSKEEIINLKLRLSEIRNKFYHQSDAAWTILVRDNLIPDATLHALSRICYELVNESHSGVTKLYRFCGLNAADTRMEINRVWRNFHTASQHSLFANHQP